MIKQLKKCFRLSNLEKQYVQSIKTGSILIGTEWNLLKNNPQMISLKSEIRRKLHNIQKGNCAYCGNKYYVTSEAHIEHIAPKSQRLHPEFMFVEHNLVLACQYCNGFIKKGTKNTITTKNSVYKKCIFNIVHPYYDNPEDHFSWSGSTDKVLISHKTVKGKKSIEMFELDKSIQSEARAKDAVYRNYTLKPAYEKLIDLVNEYKST